MNKYFPINDLDWKDITGLAVNNKKLTIYKENKEYNLADLEKFIGHRGDAAKPNAIILKNNKPVYILGSPGGSNIIGYVVNAIISMIDWKKNAQEAASVAHGINKFGTYYLEKNTIMSKLLPSLEDMKYKVKLRNFSSGLNIIHINNKLYGGSDHRRE